MNSEFKMLFLFQKEKSRVKVYLIFAKVEVTKKKATTFAHPLEVWKAICVKFL